MNIFDIVGIASKVPYDLVQKLEGDLPKIQRLIAISRRLRLQFRNSRLFAEEAEKIWASISPDVANLLKTIGVQ